MNTVHEWMRGSAFPPKVIAPEAEGQKYDMRALLEPLPPPCGRVPTSKEIGYHPAPSTCLLMIQPHYTLL